MHGREAEVLVVYVCPRPGGDQQPRQLLADARRAAGDEHVPAPHAAPQRAPFAAHQEVDDAYRQWKDNCGMASAGVTLEFATFVREMFQWGELVFREYTVDCTILFPPQPSDWNIPTKNAEAKMLTYTYAAISDEVQMLFYNNKTNSGAFCLKEGADTPTSLICVATIVHYINPG